MRRHHQEIRKLRVYREAVARIPLLGVRVLPVERASVEAATGLSQSHELLTGDALIVAIMWQHGIAAIASNDSDFDRVQGLTRYAPA